MIQAFSLDENGHEAFVSTSSTWPRHAKHASCGRQSPSGEKTTVKTALASLVIAIAALAVTPSEASAWVCYAASNTGATGGGSHNYSLGYARRRALAECAIRTPRCTHTPWPVRNASTGIRSGPCWASRRLL